MFLLAAAMILLLAAACARPVDRGPIAPATPLPPPEPAGLFTPDRQSLPEAGFAELARDAGYVLLGESHSSACDHEAQADLVRVMAEAGLDPVVGFEMVDVTYQPVLDDFSRGEVALDNIDRALGWEDRWGFDFALYRPIFEVVEQYGLRAVALNLPREVVTAVSMAGSLEAVEGLPPDRLVLIPESVIMPLPEQRDVLVETFAMHPGSGDERDEDEEAARLERFMLIQSLWDTVMAREAAAARERFGRTMAVVAGGGHVEYGWGIAHRLESLDPGAQTLVVMPWRGEPPEEGGLLEGADVFYKCALTHESNMGMVLQQIDGKVLVAQVDEGSRAWEAGLRPGDVIVAALGEPVDSLADLHTAGFEAHKADAPLVYGVQRGDETLSVDLGKLGEAGE